VLHCQNSSDEKSFISNFSDDNYNERIPSSGESPPSVDGKTLDSTLTGSSIDCNRLDSRATVDSSLFTLISLLSNENESASPARSMKMENAFMMGVCCSLGKKKSAAGEGEQD